MAKAEFQLAIPLPAAPADVVFGECLSVSESYAVHVENEKEQSYQQGRFDGERSVSDQLLAQRREVAEFSSGALQSISDALPTIVRETEQALKELSLSIARRVVANVPIDSSVVEAVVREALGRFQDASDVELILHPSDLSLLEQLKASSSRLRESLAGIQCSASGDITPGGCRVRTEFGEADATIEGKLRRVQRQLKRPFNGADSEAREESR